MSAVQAFAFDVQKGGTLAIRGLVGVVGARPTGKGPRLYALVNRSATLLDVLALRTGVETDALPAPSDYAGLVRHEGAPVHVFTRVRDRVLVVALQAAGVDETLPSEDA